MERAAGLFRTSRLALLRPAGTDLPAAQQGLHPAVGCQCRRSVSGHGSAREHNAIRGVRPFTSAVASAAARPKNTRMQILRDSDMDKTTGMTGYAGPAGF